MTQGCSRGGGEVVLIDGTEVSDTTADLLNLEALTRVCRQGMQEGDTQRTRGPAQKRDTALTRGDTIAPFSVD
jgi:hypothetical protein